MRGKGNDMCELESAVRGYSEAARGTALSVDAAKANRCADALHEHYVALRQTQAGKEAIAALMCDEDPNVRLCAARHSLEWAPDAARAALEQLRDGGGLMGLTAEYTLKEYEKGRLAFGAAAGGTGKEG